jgi:predicted metal-binding membrane protein
MQRLRAVSRRPTLWVEAGAVLSWIALALATATAHGSEGGGAGLFWGQGPLWICKTGLNGMTAHAGGGGGHSGGGLTSASLLAAAPMWALMTTAMMVPSTLPTVRHVALNSLWWRRRRATVEFLVGFLAVWIAFGVLVLGPLANSKLTASGWVLGAALGMAAAWQLTPLKQRALRACHRPRPLRARGWRASLGTARFGGRDGAACVLSCWAMMLPAGLAGPTALLWMGGVTAVVAAEKLAEKPRRASRRVAALLAAAAAGVFLAELVG